MISHRRGIDEISLDKKVSIGSKPLPMQSACEAGRCDRSNPRRCRHACGGFCGGINEVYTKNLMKSFMGVRYRGGVLGPVVA